MPAGPVSYVQETAKLASDFAKRPSRLRARVTTYALLVISDAAALLIGFRVAEYVRDEEYLSPMGISIALLTLPIYFAFSANQNAYSIDVLRSFADSIRRPMMALLLTMLLITLLGFFTQSGLLISRVAFTTAMVASGIGIMIGRYAINRVHVRKMGGVLTDTLLILDAPGDIDIGHQPMASERVIDAGMAGIAPDLNNPAMLDRLSQILRPFDRVVIACAPERQADWSIVLKGINTTGEILVSNQNQLGAIGVNEYAGFDTMVVSRRPLSLPNRLKKRLFDLAIAIPAIIFLSPLLLLTAIAIKLDSPGPVLFRQQRIGRSNRLFEMYKFRSMRVEQLDQAGNISAGREDDRVTRVGRFIRKTSIDELPQLFNVLSGQMSIVGPRPHALGSTAGGQLFWEVDVHYWMRHALKPGITGLAQVRGLRGATHARKDLEDRLQADLEYLNGWRLWRDVTIVLGTIRVLVHPNAY